MKYLSMDASAATAPAPKATRRPIFRRLLVAASATPLIFYVALALALYDMRDTAKAIVGTYRDLWKGQ